MPDLETLIDNARSLPARIGADLQGFGGILRCGSCGTERPLGDVGSKLASGWPKCCGLTMTWMTQRLLDEEASGG